MPFINKNTSPLVLDKKEYELDFESLIHLLDDTEVVLDCNISPTESDVGELYYFIRTFEGNNLIVSSVDDHCMFKCEETEEDRRVQKEEGVHRSFNDFALLHGKNLICNVYGGKVDMRTIALTSFPTPFGMYYDSMKKCNVAVMQLCVSTKTLPAPNRSYRIVPVQEAEMPKFIFEHFTFTKDKEVSE